MHPADFIGLAAVPNADSFPLGSPPLCRFQPFIGPPQLRLHLLAAIFWSSGTVQFFHRLLAAGTGYLFCNIPHAQGKIKAENVLRRPPERSTLFPSLALPFLCLLSRLLQLLRGRRFPISIQNPNPHSGSRALPSSIVLGGPQAALGTAAKNDL